VLDRRAFRPLQTAVELIAEFRRENVARFAWREPPYEYEHEKEPIDILYGTDRLRATLDADGDAAALVESWAGEEEAFRRQRKPYLLY
jgi:uncharacterized protein YbbC (DUF1343 family)